MGLCLLMGFFMLVWGLLFAPFLFVLRTRTLVPLLVFLIPLSWQKHFLSVLVLMGSTVLAGVRLKTPCTSTTISSSFCTSAVSLPEISGFPYAFFGLSFQMASSPAGVSTPRQGHSAAAPQSERVIKHEVCAFHYTEHNRRSCLVSRLPWGGSALKGLHNSRGLKRPPLRAECW